MLSRYYRAVVAQARRLRYLYFEMRSKKRSLLATVIADIKNPRTRRCFASTKSRRSTSHLPVAFSVVPLTSSTVAVVFLIRPRAAGLVASRGNPFQRKAHRGGQGVKLPRETLAFWFCIVNVSKCWALTFLVDASILTVRPITLCVDAPSMPAFTNVPCSFA